MRALLVVVVLLVAGIAGVGFYRGWFQLSTSSSDHESNVTITVDKEKIHEDEELAKEKVDGLGRRANEAITDPN